MRVVADTNTLVAAVLWSGLPSRLLELAERRGIKLYSSTYILDEVDEVLRRPQFVERLALIKKKPASIMRGLRAACTIVSPADLAPTSRDPDDDVILATALSARAQVVITGDKDLLVLNPFRGIPVLTIREFLARQFPESLEVSPRA